MNGKDYAITSMTSGIVSLGFCLLGLIHGAIYILAFIISIVGLVFANKAKKEECMNGQRTAGFVCSLIALILSSIFVFIVLLVLMIGIKFML